MICCSPPTHLNAPYTQIQEETQHLSISFSAALGCEVTWAIIIDSRHYAAVAICSVHAVLIAYFALRGLAEGGV